MAAAFFGASEGRVFNALAAASNGPGPCDRSLFYTILEHTIVYYSIL